MPAQAGASAGFDLLVGTYTRNDPARPGIFATTLVDGRFGEVRGVADAVDASWLAPSADGRVIHAVQESTAAAGTTTGGGAVASYALAGADLRLLRSEATGGDAPCHLALAPTGRHLLVAEYRGGVSAHAIDRGAVGRRRGRFLPTTRLGPRRDRQDRPHPHMVAFDPETGDALVPDLGSDIVHVLRVEHDGSLIERTDRRLRLPPGFGPRHLCFDRTGAVCFVLGELANAVAVAVRRGDGFVLRTVVSTLSAEGARPSAAAALRPSPSGRHLLVTNRGHDSIAVLAWDAGARNLRRIGSAPTAGEPRDLVFADERTVVVANHHDSSLTSYAFNDRTGDLVPVDRVEVPWPACVLPISRGAE